ncbi:MAG TPA: hydrolase [Erysipelothrix sp.]|nr:hydrolase [Erysipelothrix sp.]
MRTPEYSGNLRSNFIHIPKEIEQATGIRIFGRLIKSVIFTTDVSIIRNSNADAVMAVYPFTPQPIITHAIITSSDVPVFTGVGGGTTRGTRVLSLAIDAEQQGAMGVVLNAPSKNELIHSMKLRLEIPIIITVTSEKDDIDGRIQNGAAILNVSAASRTPEVVRYIRSKYPDVPIIATGGPTTQSITDTIEAGANAITYTPPSTQELFKEMMAKYRAF